MENDASLAKHICGVGYSYRRRVEKICRSVSLINEAVRTISKVIVSELSSVSKEGSQLQTVIQSITQQLGLMIQFQKVCQSFVSALPHTGDKGAHDKVDSMGQLSELQQTEFRSLSGKKTVTIHSMKLYSFYCNILKKINLILSLSSPSHAGTTHQATSQPICGKWCFDGRVGGSYICK